MSASQSHLTLYCMFQSQLQFQFPSIRPVFCSKWATWALCSLRWAHCWQNRSKHHYSSMQPLWACRWFSTPRTTRCQCWTALSLCRPSWSSSSSSKLSDLHSRSNPSSGYLQTLGSPLKCARPPRPRRLFLTSSHMYRPEKKAASRHIDHPWTTSALSLRDVASADPIDSIAYL